MTTKQKGFKIRVDYFLPIDKKDFTKQAAAYTLIAGIKSTGQLPADFLDQAAVIGIDAKEGSAELPETAPIDPPDEPPLPEVAEADAKNGRRKPIPDEPSE